MIATVTVADGGPPPRHPAVPLTAVVRPESGSSGYAVFVVEEPGGKPVARRRPVVLGDVMGNRIEVAEGLRVGERVVVSGATLALDGRPVRIIP